ncbi:MAG: RpiB/LacA/LacB family sugar-phosphate isomerase [Mycoplasmataceae bacterium]|jgi:ribose 5-phosphate isomerase B|nr:RpiB/LacA/LacB family sugar-phosphate isomerase [Mycoplasmataceae bacterium]
MTFNKKLYIASDHAGYDMKLKIIAYLQKNNINVTDLGTKDTTSVDYPTYAFSLGEKVASSSKNFGILVCGTGYGMCIAVNKVKHIRAVSLDTPKFASLAVTHNNINVVCLSGRFVSLAKNIRILKQLFKSSFSNQERHIGRINMIANYEK